MLSGMQKDELLRELKSSEEFFERSTRVLKEADSNYAPADGMMTVANQVAHAGLSIKWFLDGITRPEGFDMDFEKHERELRAVTSLTKAREIVSQAYGEARELVEKLGDEGLSRRLPEGQIMAGEPVGGVLLGIVEHSAHHRGALTVYSRLLGKKPLMPYMEMPEETPV
jgi:uncharacterized damage-inducible protein DinB